MVNVGSQIPFNLHNRVLPPEVNHTLSRSTSGTMDYFGTMDEYGAEVYSQPYRSTPQPRFSASPGRYKTLSPPSRSSSRERDPDAKTILNVKLVGYVDRRGRTAQRKQPDAAVDLESDSTPTHSTMEAYRSSNQSAAVCPYCVFF